MEPTVSELLDAFRRLSPADQRRVVAVVARLWRREHFRLIVGGRDRD